MPKLCWNVCCKAYFEPGRSRHGGSAVKGHALWKPDTWMLLFPVPHLCKLPPPSAQTPPVPLEPLSFSDEATLSKAEPGSRCLNCLQSAEAVGLVYSTGDEGGTVSRIKTVQDVLRLVTCCEKSLQSCFLTGWLSTSISPLQTIIKFQTIIK